MVLALKYSRSYEALKKEPKVLLKDFPFALPNSYLEILKKQDGVSISYEFQYYDHCLKRKIGTGIGVIFGLDSDDEENLLKQYHTLPDFFPKNLVPFGEDGGGDFICFDYRHDAYTNNPPVVYWSHENEEGEDISFLAKDFKEFLSILKEPED